MTKKYKILTEFIKDMSCETPDVETYLFVKKDVNVAGGVNNVVVEDLRAYGLSSVYGDGVKDDDEPDPEKRYKLIANMQDHRMWAPAYRSHYPDPEDFPHVLPLPFQELGVPIVDSTPIRRDKQSFTLYVGQLVCFSQSVNSNPSHNTKNESHISDCINKISLSEPCHSSLT